MKELICIKTKCALIIITFFNTLIYSQVVYYQDVYKGGVCFAGFSTGLTYGNGTFETYVEPNSLIKKVILVYNIHNEPIQPYNIILDGIKIPLENQSYNNEKYFETQFTNLYKFGVGVLDITSVYQDVQIHSIEVPSQNYLDCGVNCAYRNFSIVVIYENASLPIVSFTLLLNNQNLNVYENYYQYCFNPIYTGQPVSFSLNTDIINSPTTNDGCYVYVENNNIGLIGGADNINLMYVFGTRGHFYYQNNQIYGLDDDTADSIMANSDALADISSYISNNTINWKLQWQNIYVHQNIYSSFNFAYTTPCDTFATSLLTEDTMVCMGNTVQLGASGGNTTLSKPAYEWLPQKDLSCYDCPNPVFSGDTSRVYTVRIWNTDSCSKVLPVRVKVLPQPKFGQIHLTSTPCGTNNGKITVSSPAGDSLFVNNNFAGLVPTTVSGLAAGQYTLQLKDTLGCSSTDSVVQIAVQNPPNALFSLIPPSGAAPLTVQANNQSSHANTYQWVWQNQSSTSVNPTFQFDTSGTYTITLIASQNGACADTFSLALVVYDSLQITVPNIFTPNNDGVNEVFSITTNQELPVKLSIQNRWGNDVFTFEGVLKTGENKLWNGEDVTEGVYFVNLQYINPKDKKQVSFQGFVSVSR